MPSIYTKTGDRGHTALLGGSRVKKDDLRVDCYGTLDEASAAIGIAYAMIEDEEIKGILRRVQEKILILGGELASDAKGKTYLREEISIQDVENLEVIIDDYSQRVGPQKQFILPGQAGASAFLHLSRTVIRRGERLMVSLEKQMNIRKELMVYTNRLSDLLFVLARADAELRIEQ